MFAARRLALIAGTIRRKRHLATGLLWGLLIGLPLSGMAETAAPEATDTAPAVIADTPQVESNAEPVEGSVARALFTSAIVNREPVDNLSTVANDIQRLFFFSDLRGLAGEIVTHRWEYEDRVMAEVTFKVGEGARWRVYSSKNLLPEWTGQWTVVVSNASGQPLATSRFDYTAKTTDGTATTVSP
ncbi:MAG: DUF2914 domain-containing protein [Gammaproteobacteria bacterium]|nr:DUF2914 domain-containing protein [Gammaproteobacteria bacterium]